MGRWRTRPVTATAAADTGEGREVGVGGAGSVASQQQQAAALSSVASTCRCRMVASSIANAVRFFVPRQRYSWDSSTMTKPTAAGCTKTPNSASSMTFLSADTAGTPSPATSSPSIVGVASRQRSGAGCRASAVAAALVRALPLPLDFSSMWGRPASASAAAAHCASRALGATMRTVGLNSSARTWSPSLLPASTPPSSSSFFSSFSLFTSCCCADDDGDG